jgi:hypothetical protein
VKIAVRNKRAEHATRYVCMQIMACALSDAVIEFGIQLTIPLHCGGSSYPNMLPDHRLACPIIDSTLDSCPTQDQSRFTIRLHCIMMM